MSDERLFVAGRCYFLVGYYDQELKFPFMETYVFIGKKGGDGTPASRELWCFQDAASYVRAGSTFARDVEGAKTLFATSENLETILDADQLARELDDIERRDLRK